MGARGRFDDLGAVDALEVDARDVEVGVSELSLDHYLLTAEIDATLRRLQ